MKEKISNSMIRNVLLNVVTAGEEEIRAEKPVRRMRYYFYSAPPEYSIKFTHLTEILKKKNNPEKRVLIEKLKGGNSGKYCADYFRWKKLYIVTNQYSPDRSSNIVYEVELSPLGTKIQGTENIYPADAPVTISDVEADLSIYTSKRGTSNLINVDVGESLFLDKDPPKNMVKILLNNLKPLGNYLDYNEFSKIFDEYRVWSTNLNVLLLPDYNIPKNDDVKGGHYYGGIDAFEKFVKPYIEEEKEEKEKKPSLKEKLEEEEEIYRPVSETNKEAQMDTPITPMKPTDRKGKGISQKLMEDAKKHEVIKKKLEETAKQISQLGY